EQDRELAEGLRVEIRERKVGHGVDRLTGEAAAVGESPKRLAHRASQPLDGGAAMGGGTVIEPEMELPCRDEAADLEEMRAAVQEIHVRPRGLVGDREQGGVLGGARPGVEMAE